MFCPHCGKDHEHDVFLDLTTTVQLTLTELTTWSAEQLETEVAHRLRAALESQIADGHVLRVLEAAQARLHARQAPGQQD